MDIEEILKEWLEKNQDGIVMSPYIGDTNNLKNIILDGNFNLESLIQKSIEERDKEWLEMLKKENITIYKPLNLKDKKIID